MKTDPTANVDTRHAAKETIVAYNKRLRATSPYQVVTDMLEGRREPDAAILLDAVRSLREELSRTNRTLTNRCKDVAALRRALTIVVTHEALADIVE